MLKYLKVNMNKMRREKDDINLKEIYRLDSAEEKSSENGKPAWNLAKVKHRQKKGMKNKKNIRTTVVCV